MIDFHYLKFSDVPARLGIEPEQWRQHLLCAISIPYGYLELHGTRAWCANASLPGGEPTSWPWQVVAAETRLYKEGFKPEDGTRAMRLQGWKPVVDDDPAREREFRLSGWCRVSRDTVRFLARTSSKQTCPVLYPLDDETEFALESIDTFPGDGETISASQLWFKREDIDALASAGPAPPTDEGDALDSRERASLYAIIGAVASMAKLAPQPYKAGGVLEAFLDGYDVKLSARAIGEHLKAVDEFMRERSSRWPPSQ